MIDIGGSNVKCLVTGQTEPREQPSGKTLTPANMVAAVKKLSKDWKYDVISIGYPGLIGSHGPSSEPGNLGNGWVGFDFSAAFDQPVRYINDAAMQALGSYEGGRMLFLGFGTGLGSALIAEQTILSLELGQLSYKSKTLGDVLGHRGAKKIGKTAWRRIVMDVVPILKRAFWADDVVLGGGNAKELKELPPGVRLGHNLTAFRGGFRLWEIDDELTAPIRGKQVSAHRFTGGWKLI